MPYSTDDVAAALSAAGVQKLAVVADADDVNAMEHSTGCIVDFGEALRLALQAFLVDERGSPGQGGDSVVAMLRAQPSAFGLPDEPDAAAIGDVLRRALHDDPDAKIVLLSTATTAQEDYRFTPEYGERIGDTWVFRILAPASFPALIWAVVDKTGQTQPYCYAFD